MCVRHPVFNLGLLLILLAGCSTEPALPPELQSQGRPPIRNAEGWTTFSPAPETRILYVSSSRGDDGTGEVYRASDPAVAADPRKPDQTIKAFKTFAAAFRHTRDGRGDWILLRRGDSFQEALAVRNGQSDAAPFLLASYGEEPTLPQVDPGSERALNICCESFNDVAIQGLEFYAAGRDFDSPQFRSSDGALGISAYVKEGYSARGLLIEGCRLRFFTGNALQADGRLTDVVFRRNVVTDNYSTRGHAQGLFARGISIVVEENIFDHNGWYKKQETDRVDNRAGGQATMFNHNTYFQDMHDVVYRSNILLRPSSIGSKWTANRGEASTRNVIISDNLYIDGEIGISIGGNKKGPYRFKNITLQDNVLLNIGQSQPTDRDFAWYMEVKDWDGGRISGNIFAHPGSDTTDNIYAMRLSGENREVAVEGNRVYGFGNGHAFSTEEDASLNKVRFVANEFFLHPSARHFFRIKGAIQGLSFQDNRYHRPTAGPAFAVNGNRLPAEGWARVSGEEQAQSLRAPAPLGNLVEDYQRALEQRREKKAGSGDAFVRFVAALREQSYTNWNEDYTASAVNRWIRQRLGSGTESTAALAED